MISPSLVIMGVVATAITIGYLGINNYQLRQETVQVVSDAEMGDASLIQSLDDLKKENDELQGQLAAANEDVKKIKNEKSEIEAQLKKVEEAGIAAMAMSNEEQEKVLIELEEAEMQVANLINRFMELTGQTPMQDEDGSFGASNLGSEESSLTRNSSDEEEEVEEST